MLLNGTILGDRYEIIEMIGSGGMADVYKAKCHKLNRFVAIKVLKAEYASDHNFVVKFRAEAQAAAGLMHPNIVNVYDVGEEAGLYYFVMELVEGITLKHYIEKKIRLTVKEAVSIAIQVAMGIEAAHNNGIIHRDIKPQNIMISKEGKVKVADFGIAKAVSSDTITSHAMGSVHYTSPEQARGGYSDAKSDIYSIGITLFEMVTGHVPFDGETTVAIAIKQIQAEMPSPRVYVPDIPLSVEQIIFKCTQKNPDRRYANTAELIADFKRSLQNPDGDFVVVNNPASSEGTKTVSDNERTQIRQQTSAVVSGPAYNNIIPSYPENDMQLRTPNVSRNNGGRNIEQIQEDDYDPFEVRGERGRNAAVRGSYAEEDVQPKQSKRQNHNTGRMADKSSKERNPRQDARRYQQYREDDYYGDDELVDEVDPKMEKTVTVLMVVAAIVITIAAVFVIMKVFGVFSSETDSEEILISTQADSQGVPNVVGMSVADASEALTQAGLTAKATYAESTEYEKDFIISQDIEAGTNVSPGTVLNLVVSSGKVVGVAVPDVVGKTEAEAKVQLENEGFKVQKQIQDSAAVEKGVVISQNPLGATNAPSGSTITIMVSSGEADASEQVEVPDIVGKDEATAKSMLEAVGLVCSKVTEENNDAVAQGLVLSQTYAAGSMVDPGTTVDFTVSLGSANYTYSCSVTVNAPNDYFAGSQAVIILMSDAGEELSRYSVTEFPYTVEKTAIENSASGYITVTYMDGNAAWQTTSPVAVTFTKEE